MEVELFKLLALLHEESSRAYWRTADNCGSDVSIQCEPCSHYAQCIGAVEIERKLKEIEWK